MSFSPVSRSYFLSLLFLGHGNLQVVVTMWGMATCKLRERTHDVGFSCL